MNGQQLFLDPHLARVALVILIGFGVPACHGETDWPQWRGPTRDGVVPAASVPAPWPERFIPVWQVEVGEGHSSPVVAGGRVFVHSRRDPEELVTALALADGSVSWQHAYAAPFEKNQYARRIAKGPYATPLVSGDRVFTLGATAVLKAWDTATGRELWGRTFPGSAVTTNMFCGTAASPLLVDGRVVVQVGSDVHGGQILALDPADGTERWRWNGPGPGYASPVLVETEGTRQIVAMTERSVVGLDAASGQELWTVAFPDEWHENIVTPLWTGAHLVLSGIRQGTHAYHLKRSDGKWVAEEAWKNATVAMYMSTPVHGDGLIYGHSAKQRGQFVALEAATGAIRWASEGRAGDHASVLLAPERLLCLTSTGELVVVRRGAQALAVERRYSLAASETWATPVFLGDGLVLRDSTHVRRLSGAATRRAPN